MSVKAITTIFGVPVRIKELQWGNPESDKTTIRFTGVTSNDKIKIGAAIARMAGERTVRINFAAPKPTRKILDSTPIINMADQIQERSLYADAINGVKYESWFFGIIKTKLKFTPSEEDQKYI